ncbi:MAG: GGDEF domain-containing protein [Marinobacter sp.]
MPKTATEVTDNTQSQFRVTGEIPVPVLINWISVAAAPLLAFFAWRSLDRGDQLTPVLLTLFAALLAGNILIYAISRHAAFHRRAFMVLITTLFTYLAVNAVEDGSAIIWLFAYPPIVFYISEARVGVATCVMGLVGVMLLFSPLANLTQLDVSYSTNFRITMVLALAFEMITCYILDRSRRRSKLGLLALASEFEYAAKHDALTGLANRREALAQLEAEYERYLRNGRPFTVLLADIDLFKNINDTHGHHVGDDLIVLVGNTFLDQCRKVDTVARWGGEEYLVLLAETGTDEAVHIANRIREAIAENAVMVDQKPIACTASIGVASIHGQESIDRLLQRSDEALYLAKTLGRNRVCVHQKQAQV